MMHRYFKLYAAFFRNCFVRLLDYRGEFFMSIFAWTMWTGLSLVFLWVVFAHIHDVQGWTKGDMVVLYGTFAVLESLLHALIVPNMSRVSEYIRQGTLDVVLTKPVSTQFYASTRYVHFGGLFNAVLGFAILWMGLRMTEAHITLDNALLFVYLMLCGFLIAYSLWFMSVTCAFWFVRLDNIGWLFDPILRVARFPMTIYPRKLQFVFTTVLPIVFLTTVPVETLLGRSPRGTLLAATAAAGVLVWLSNAFWRFALRRYESASS